MKRDTKSEILMKAYLLFLEKGYDAVSISMIQNEVGIGRATMYHHFKSKKELFDSVIELYFLGKAKQEKLDEYKSVVLSEYLKDRIEKGRLELKASPLPKNIGMLNYFIMTFQALEMNPSLSELSKKAHDYEVSKWEMIIQNSIESGEVINSIDVEKTAKLFMNIRHGIGVTSTHATSMEDTIDAIEEMYEYIFSLIRKEQ